ncbi:hypothetical protein B1A99_14830 [Cohnella sp. CIP 111063]|uniref:hypothetical protein n=1 Tax=unclassified Cohnella TaxID=2636738 RepID=UPI000B9D29F8|nr:MULTISPECIES: hypothetical protein [unclassified Cohnella]OXS57912.1 hypothetical protein B1A99_14830 [Cohnella sp. CIP 111063]PRX71235.1 hypothetical protein B0G52_10931 [Cohnella sp. SGD-V74]
MTDRPKDNLVLFPKTLDYYQIQLTKMLETERYGDAKALLAFLLQCKGEAERHHTEWQALLGWLEAAFPSFEGDSGCDAFLQTDGNEEDEGEEEIFQRRLSERSQADANYIPELLAALYNGDDPGQQMLILGQLQHVFHPDIDGSLRQWLAREEYIPPLQYRALQAIRKQGGSGPVAFWRDGESLTVEAADTPLSFAEFPQGMHQVLERVKQSAEVSDPTLSYFAEETWKDCAELAYGTPTFKSMAEDDDGSSDIWAAALHQLLMEKLHAKHGDEGIREQYGITDELRFRYEQALRWLRNYAMEPQITDS